MASLLFTLLLLQAPAARTGDGALPLPLIRSIDLDAGALLDNPALLAADVLLLRVECSRGAYYKLSERGEVLAAGMLLPGSNSVRCNRPGLCAQSQSLLLVLDLLESGRPSRKNVRVMVAVAAGAGTDGPGKELSGSFTLEMHHAGQAIGFRKKHVKELLTLKTGPVVPVPDPALSGSAGRSPSAGQSISVLGVAMALAKYLGRKKAEKRLKAHTAELQKKKLALSIPLLGANGEKREIPIVIELKTE